MKTPPAGAGPHQIIRLSNSMGAVTSCASRQSVAAGQALLCCVAKSEPPAEFESRKQNPTGLEEKAKTFRRNLTSLSLVRQSRASFKVLAFSAAQSAGAVRLPGT